ncbi:MAG: protein Mom [Chloroflexota bacterium]|jgi:hypothetical protein
MISPRPDLRLDWCSHAAARYAVETWHYSRSMPTPPLVKIGAWEDGRYIGCVLFSRGASPDLGNPYGLTVTGVCELTRVALSSHQVPTSRVVAVALRFLRQRSPGLRLCVSFADPNQGHHGGIYQAGGWVYTGEVPSTPKYQDAAGRVWHNRQVAPSGVRRQYNIARRVPRTADCIVLRQLPKHRYLMPLDDAMRAQIAPLAQPYPKRAKHPSDAPAVQVGEGGAAPTRTLQEATV